MDNLIMLSVLAAVAFNFLHFIISVVVALIIAGVLWWLVTVIASMIPGFPPQLVQIAQVLIVLAFVIWIVSILLGFVA